MAKNAVKSSSALSSNPVAQALQEVLKETYSVFLLTHNYHWNVEGPQFVSLHALFEQQYTELFQAIDVIAERIRALGDYALPHYYEEILSGLQQVRNPVGREKDKTAVSERMIHNLIEVNNRVVEAAQAAKQAAARAGDDESQDLAIERISVHQKTLWMLNSIVR